MTIRRGGTMQGRGKGLFFAPIIVVLLLVGSLGGGCTTTPKPSTSAPTSGTSAPPPSVAEQPAGELKIAMNSFWTEVLDPSLSSTHIKPLLIPMYEFLVGADVSGKLSKAYGIAQDWKVEHSATNSVYTFDLRQGVKFHDGTEVTAQDVKFSIEYFARADSKSSMAATLRPLIDRIEVPSQYRVVVYTKKPYAFLLTDLSPLGYSEGLVLPKGYIEKNGSEYFNKHPIGTGPYRFKEQKVGTSVTYEAIDYQHWLFRVPKYKTVTLMLVPEESTRLAMLKTKEADVIDSVTTANIPSLKAAGSGVFSQKGSQVLMVLLGQTWDESSYLNDIRVREALNLAVDRQAIVDQIFQKAAGVIGAWYGSYAYGYQPLPLYDYDPAKAKSLLQQAIKDKGWSKVELTFYSYPRAGVPEAQQAAETMAGMWQKAFGDLINVQIVPAAEFAIFRQKLVDKKGANGVGILGSPNGPFAWGPAWQSLYHSGGVYPLAKTPQLDALIGGLRAETDMEKAGQEQVQIAKYIRDNHFNVPLFETSDIYGTNPQKVTQWELSKFDHNPNYLDIMVRGRAYPAK
ncbi:MAG: ABC transporter substrate-binding protein [Chloroflexota bacterium]|nr:MAG: ABC transporter substrate-binding protein [Chloroflexota bacterium]